MTIAEFKKGLISQPVTLYDRNKLKYMLSDLFMHNFKEINILLQAYDEHIVDSLLNSDTVTESDLHRFTSSIIENHHTNETFAKKAVDLWYAVIDYDVKLAAKEWKNQESSENLASTDSTSNQASNKTSSPDELLLKTETDLYVNPSLTVKQNRIFVPCGIGNSDNGFFVYGIKKSQFCEYKYANKFALVYNFLLRNSQIGKNDLPGFIRNDNRFFSLDYRAAYRLAVVMLLLVKNNYVKNNTLELSYFGNSVEFEAAKLLINTYEAMFSRIMNEQPSGLKLINSHNGIRLSDTHQSGNCIYYENNTEFISNARELWYGTKIDYHFSKNNTADLEYLLSEISDYKKFKPGQFEAICKMVSARDHSVCIMPTGSGKSLIFYIISFLQPLPLFVVSPTDILIHDQIRNLKTHFNTDNVAHLQLTDENDFRLFTIFNSINYLTPSTLQNRNLLTTFRAINNGCLNIKNESGLIKEEKLTHGPLLSYIVLDEIHCLSNWGHDFRPEYLMLSQYLDKYLDLIPLLGFTATANYTVVSDIEEQLHIPRDNFISPFLFDSKDITYSYICAEDNEQMLYELEKIIKPIIDKRERTLVFTKYDSVSIKVADAIGYEADVFTYDNPDAYKQFADKKCLILVAAEDLGIGINLPEVKNIIHFGMPLSKSEYVQEIGRAGRNNESVHSYVIYLSSEKAPEGLLNRSNKTIDTPEKTDNENDYYDILLKLTNNCPTQEILCNHLIKKYHDFEKYMATNGPSSFCQTYTPETIDMERKELYMLYVIGYIHDWYSKSKNDSDTTYYIDIKSTDSSSYIKNPKKMLLQMITKTKDYFAKVKNNRESIAKISKASSEEEIITIYVEWFYKQYLYHHKEQFIDIFDFISNASTDNEELTLALKDYFVLPFIQIKSEEEKYATMTLSEMGDLILSGLSKSMVTNAERINSDTYSNKIDLLLFAAELKFNDKLDLNRLNRVYSSLSPSERIWFSSFLPKLYSKCNIKGRLEFANLLERNSHTYGLNENTFYSEVYKNAPKDLVYYGRLIRNAKNTLRNIWGSNNVQ